MKISTTILLVITLTLAACGPKQPSAVDQVNNILSQIGTSGTTDLAAAAPLKNFTDVLIGGFPATRWGEGLVYANQLKKIQAEDPIAALIDLGPSFMGSVTTSGGTFEPRWNYEPEYLKMRAKLLKEVLAGTLAFNIKGNTEIVEIMPTRQETILGKAAELNTATICIKYANIPKLQALAAPGIALVKN